MTVEHKAQKLERWVAGFVERDGAPKLEDISLPAPASGAARHVRLVRGPATMALGLLFVEQRLHECDRPTLPRPELFGPRGSAVWSLVSQLYRGRKQCWATKFKRACLCGGMDPASDVFCMTHRRDPRAVRGIAFRPGVTIEIRHDHQPCDQLDQLRCLRSRIHAWLEQRGCTVNATHTAESSETGSSLRTFGAMVIDCAKKTVCAPASVNELLEGQASDDDVEAAQAAQCVGLQFAIDDNYPSAWPLSLRVAWALKGRDGDGYLRAMVLAAESLWRLGRTQDVLAVLGAAVRSPSNGVRPQTLARFKSCVGLILQEVDDLRAGRDALAEAARLSVSDPLGDTRLDRMTASTIAKRHAWVQGHIDGRKPVAKIDRLARQQAAEGFDQPYCNTLAAQLYFYFHFEHFTAGLDFAHEHRDELARASVGNRILALGSEAQIWIHEGNTDRALPLMREAIRLYRRHQLQPPCLLSSPVGRAYYLDETHLQLTGTSCGTSLPRLYLNPHEIGALTTLGQAI